MAIPTPDAQLGGIAYALAELYSVLGIDRSEMAGDYRVIDLSRVVYQAIAKAREMKRGLSDAKLAADLAEAKADDLRKALDEAKAEIAAMLEDRRAEEERARMRLLERVVVSAINHGKDSAATVLPQCAATPPSAGTAKMREALLADLDALVALGLRGEVVP